MVISLIYNKSIRKRNCQMSYRRKVFLIQAKNIFHCENLLKRSGILFSDLQGYWFYRTLNNASNLNQRYLQNSK